MDTITINGEWLKSLSPHKLSKWLQLNRLELATASVFTRSGGWLSPTIEFLTRRECIEKDFIPSHIGNVILLNSKLYIFNQKPPKASIIELYDYIMETKDDFKIVIIDEHKIDISQFSYDLFCCVEEKYGYLSALQCLKGLRWLPQKTRHCSEIATMEYQKWGYFEDIKADDTSPAKLYSLMVYGGYYD